MPLATQCHLQFAFGISVFCVVYFWVDKMAEGLCLRPLAAETLVGTSSVDGVWGVAPSGVGRSPTCFLQMSQGEV
jgi:hypothetical protein